MKTFLIFTLVVSFLFLLLVVVEDYRVWSSQTTIDSYWACQTFEENRMENWEEHCAGVAIKSYSPYFFERFIN